jgi:hypothetical protein
MAETRTPVSEMARQSGTPRPTAEVPRPPVVNVGERVATMADTGPTTVGLGIDALANFQVAPQFAVGGELLGANATVGGRIPSAEKPVATVTATEAPKGTATATPTSEAASPVVSEQDRQRGVPIATGESKGSPPAGSSVEQVGQVDPRPTEKTGAVAHEPTSGAAQAPEVKPTVDAKSATETKPADQAKPADVAEQTESAQPVAEREKTAEQPKDPKELQAKLLKDIQDGKVELHDAIQQYANLISETSRTQLRADFAKSVMEQMDKMNAVGPEQKGLVFKLLLDKANEIRDKIAEVDALEQSLIELPQRIEQLKAERQTKIDAVKRIKDTKEPTDSKARAEWAKNRTKADFDLWTANISLLNALYMMHTGTARAAELHAEIDRRQGVSKGFDAIKDWAQTKIKSEIAEVQFAVEAAGNGAIASLV